MTGVTIARASMLDGPGIPPRHPSWPAALSATTTPSPTRPRYSPSEPVSSVPSTMWFMFRTKPGEGHHRSHGRRGRRRRRT